jgi:hypothetical protein
VKPEQQPSKLSVLKSSPSQKMNLTEILLVELVRYQPFTNCRKTVERIIENAWNAGLLESLDPFSKVDPNLQRLKKCSTPSLRNFKKTSHVPATTKQRKNP